MQSVDDLKLEQELRNQTKVRLFNPDKVDITVLYHGKPVVIHALEIEEYPYDMGQHLKNYLIDHLINIRDIGYPTPEIREKLAKEIEVEL